MAWSGTGSGIISDPYIITTVEQITEMGELIGGVYTYAGSYFKLGNDIDMQYTQLPLIGQHFDGDGKQLNNWKANPCIGPSTGVLSNSTFTNVICNVTLAYLKFFPNAGAADNVTFTDIELYAEGATVLSKVGHDWTIERVKCVGSIPCFIKSFSTSGNSSNISDIKILNTSGRCELVAATFNSLCFRCQVVLLKPADYVPSYLISSLGNLGILRESFILSLFSGRPDIDYDSSGVSLVSSSAANGIIEDCYIKIINLYTNKNRLLNSPGRLGTIRNDSLTAFNYILYLRRTISIIENIIPTSSYLDPWFDDLGYSDWYIPSRDELHLINSYRLKFNWPIKTNSSNIYYISSSEDKNTSCYVSRSAYSPSSSLKTNLYSLILVRDLIDIPGEFNLGDEFEGTIIIYKDGTSGIGASKTAVANGYPLFNFGSTNSLLGTSTSIGSGKTNTFLLVQNNVFPIGAANWMNAREYISPIPINYLGGIDNSLKTESIYNCFSNKDFTEIQNNPELDFYSLSIANIINLQTSDLLDASNFSGFNFDTIWGGGDGTTPIYLQNNQLEDYGVPIVVCKISNISRINETSFEILLLYSQLSGNSTYGVEIYYEGSFSEEITNTTNIQITNAIDGNYEVKPFVLINEVKQYDESRFYYHFSLNNALLDLIQVEPSIQLIETSTLSYPHGLCLYNGYIYAGIRNNPYNPVPLIICKCNILDISDYLTVRIRTKSELEYPDSYFEGLTNLLGLYSAYGNSIEQLVECNGYIYGIYSCSLGTSGNCLLQFNPEDNSYKVFSLFFGVRGHPPILTDGTYLYIVEEQFVKKIHPLQFEQAPNQFNTDGTFNIVIESQYDSSLQGGYAEEIHPSVTIKGYCHSAVTDDEFLYINYTSEGPGSSSGYNKSLGISVHESHKIRKSDMTPAGYATIPKSTDDCCQTETHIFHGIEVQPAADPNTYGYGWGAFAVRKSDMAVLGIKRLHETDNPPSITSYASLIFGNYLIDSKTNKKIYVLDISNVDNWSLDDPAGTYTLAVFDYSSAPGVNGVINEIVLADHFIGTSWDHNGQIVQFDLPGYNFFIAPIVETRFAIIDETTVNLRGWISNTGSQEIIQRGFEYGVSSESLNQTEYSLSIINEFSVEITLSPGTYYYRAFATNSEGTGYGEITSFIVESISTVPTVVTGEISAITHESAQCSGNVSDNGGAEITAQGVCWRDTLELPTISDSKTEESLLSSSFLSTLTGLLPNTLYYVRAYAINSEGTSYGSQVSFTTLSTVPEVTTVEISSIGFNSATCSSNITSAGGQTILSKGVCWSTSETPTILDSKTEDGMGLGIFSSTLSELLGETLYYVRAYATNATGTSYGEQLSFSTLKQLASSPTNFKLNYQIRVFLTWDDPVSIGYGELLGFQIKRKLHSASEWTIIYNNSTTIEYSFTDIVESNIYDYQITAITSEGLSPEYATQSIDVSSGSGGTGGKYKIYVGSSEVSFH